MLNYLGVLENARPSSMGRRVALSLICTGAAALLLFPRPAQGQDLFEATDFSSVWTSPEDPTVNAEQCADNETIVVGWTLDADPADDQEIIVTTSTDENCGSEIEEIVERAAVSGEDRADVRARDILPECPDVEEDIRYICVRVRPVTGAEAGRGVSIPVLVDTVAPEPPDELGAMPADEALHVEWSWSDERPSDLASVLVLYREEGSTAEPREKSAARTASGTRIDGLQNGVMYEIWVRAIDEVGNVGDDSDRVTEAPQPTVGFWELYREAGGEEIGGCSASGISSGGFTLAMGLVFSLLLLVGNRRRARGGLASSIGSAAALALIVFAPPASAWAGSHQDESSGWFLELELGPYLPDVDSELEGDTPFRDVFGSSSRLMTRVRAERSLWRGVGQLGMGFSASFARASGQALYADGTRSPDTNNFNWLPLQLSLSYRFDHTVRAWNVPLVPYIRAGLSATTWWISGPDGVEVDDEGNRASGIRPGWFYGGGLKFLLNVIDPRLAKDFRRSAGVEHTYLYVDVTRMEVDGFGTPGFILSDTTWFVGLAFEL